MSTFIRAGIIGAAGYTGGETLRLLLHHPGVDVVFAQSRSQVGKAVASVHTDLLGDTTLNFIDGALPEVDVLFLCLGHGESSAWLAQQPVSSHTRIIDLSQDFRLGESVGERTFVYGLPEVNREAIRHAHNVANPGCFATAIQLGLLPLAAANLLGDVHTTGITGSTGAGQKLQDTTHFSWRANNVSAYKTLNHQHLREIRRTLATVQAGYAHAVNFVPWRGDFTRGIFVTSVVQVRQSLREVQDLYTEYYAHAPFTHVATHAIDLKQVVNTNKCLVYLEKEGDTLAIHTAIDNLLKGASGQAVQNMNLMVGLDETAGLKLKSTAF